MKSKNIILTLLALLTISTAHAESYKFTTAPWVQYSDYKGQPNPSAEINYSTLNISGTEGVITDMNASLWIRTLSLLDMTFILVGPNNKGVILASNAGGNSLGHPTTGEVTNLHLNFNDEGKRQLSYAAKEERAQISSAFHNSDWFKPSVYSEVPAWFPERDFAFRNPLASGIFDSIDFAETNSLSAFDGISANGTWQLLSYDNGRNSTYKWRKQYLLDTALQLHDWSLIFSTAASTSEAVPEPAEWMLMGVCACGIVILKLRSRYNHKAI